MSEISSLSCEQRATLSQFRNAVSDILEPKHDDEYLLRWLIARNFDIAKAEKMIRKSHKFIYNLEGQDILNDYQLPEVIQKYFITKFWGFDEEGSPVRFMYVGKMDWKGIFKSVTVVDFIKSILYIMALDQKRAKEYAEQTGKKNKKCVYVWDYKDIPIDLILDKLMIKYFVILMPAYPDNFPEMLKAAYLINVPSYFYIAFKIIKPFLDEKTLKKLHIFPDNRTTDMIKNIGPKTVPKYYGGEQDDPELDPENFVNVSKVPQEFCTIGDNLYLKWNDPNSIRILVCERSSLHHKINIEKPGTLLKWAFQTKDYNIRYGVFFEESENFSKKPSLKELQEVQFVDSQLVPERGEVLCEEAGVYIFLFDNTHSWMRKKHVLMQIFTEEPKP